MASHNYSRRSSEDSSASLLVGSEHVELLPGLKTSPRRTVRAAFSRYAPLASAAPFALGLRIAYALLPSWMRRRVLGEPKEPSKLFPTSSLDGLRGVAALFVFFFHFLFNYENSSQYGYGVDGNNIWIHQLPMIRIFMQGMAMVSVFFVISGYVLSYKPVKYMNSRSWESLFQNLASSTFRRGIRLFGPTTIATFITMICVRLGMYEYGRAVNDDGHTLAGSREVLPRHMGTWREQFVDWAIQMRFLSFMWNWGECYMEYDPHLWTIPVC